MSTNWICEGGPSKLLESLKIQNLQILIVVITNCNPFLPAAYFWSSEVQQKTGLLVGQPLEIRMRQNIKSTSSILPEEIDMLRLTWKFGINESTRSRKVDMNLPSRPWSTLWKMTIVKGKGWCYVMQTFCHSLMTLLNRPRQQHLFKMTMALSDLLPFADLSSLVCQSNEQLLKKPTIIFFLYLFLPLRGKQEYNWQRLISIKSGTEYID